MGINVNQSSPKYCNLIGQLRDVRCHGRTVLLEPGRAVFGRCGPRRFRLRFTHKYFMSTSSYQPRLLSLTAVAINPFLPHTFHRKCRSFRPGQDGDVYMSVGRWKVGLCDPPSILPWSSTNYYASYPDISFISESRSS